MPTKLFAVTEETLKRLVSNPDSIGEFESKETYETHLWQSLPYFLTGGEEEEEEEEEEEDSEDEDEDEEPQEAVDDDDGEDAHPLAVVLSGDRAVKCKRLENGAFHTITASRAAELSVLLAAVKPAAIKKLVLATELEEALDGELYEELEQLDLTDPDAAAARIVKDLKSLVAFYASVAKQDLAIVLTTP
jgi:hypothetical protein